MTALVARARQPSRRIAATSCTHVCFIHASLKASAKAKALDVPRAYLSGLG